MAATNGSVCPALNTCHRQRKDELISIDTAQNNHLFLLILHYSPHKNSVGIFSDIPVTLHYLSKINLETEANELSQILESKATRHEIWGMEETLHTFLNPVLDAGDWLASRCSRFIATENVPSIHWIKINTKFGRSL
jgi:hypothetical protein